MPPSKRAVAAWDALNERQRVYMAVFYRADQDNERHWKGAWGRGEDAPPASEWRWLEYGNVGNSLAPLGKLQLRLESRGVRDPGSGSTLETLEGRGLIQTRQKPSIIGYRLEVKLTALGRAACRAGGLDPGRAGSPGRGQLSETLWSMLVDVHEAGPDGLERKVVGRGWLRLIEREPEPLVERAPASDTDFAAHFGPWRLRLTDAGRQHYAEHWEAYARLYPGVDAPRPGSGPVWPPEVDEALQRRRAACHPVLRLLRDMHDELARVAAVETTSPATLPDGPPPLVRAAKARNKAAAAYNAAVAKAADRYRTALEEQAADLSALYRHTVAQYAAAAAAVVHAVTAGQDPARAADTDPGDTGVWPWAPDVPVTGLREVDANLGRAHKHAVAPSKPNARAVAKTAARRRKLGFSPPAPVLEPDAARLLEYADELAALTAGGKLVRLLMRDQARAAKT
ncbi:hypothetical protein [Nonomuraea glycinis]|uniref:hypothetical protein n=1 Tax=Nonomuraea glycinis TaxID=2047744 RepID=UPI0033A7AE1C